MRSFTHGDAESSPASSFRFLRSVLLLAGACVLLFAGALALDWRQQAVLGVVTVLLAMWMDRTSSSYLVTLTLIFVSIHSTFRYGYWRLATASGYLLQPSSRSKWAQDLFILALLLAEAYAAATLLLGYLQTLWPLRRMPVPLPDDLREWPSVDLLIPTCNEPLGVVRYTALAALNIDWPADKLNVYILDDGRREDFRTFAEQAGIGYIARAGNEHAKAGNLNAALQQLSSPFAAVFDCDHVPTRSFLQIAMGWFLRDERLGMLQTPQHLYSPDPFDRNFDQFRTTPNEGELFYGIVQDGNDFWNSTLFCGSCAVLRRSALDEIGGVAPETLTEDVHTSLRMQMDGWNTAYINIPQAAGLAPESLDGHVKQRIRWARGMVQILRIDNPLFARGLTLAQRLCYFSCMFHFLHALPRLIFLAAPLAYLIFGSQILPGSWPTILAFALPHLLMSSVANSRIQGQHRYSFWNEIYETVLAPYILFPTLIALFKPGSGRFDVTPKGGLVVRDHFDGKTAIPFLLMMVFQMTGLVFGVALLWDVPWLKLPYLHHGANPGAVLMNMFWALFNLVILGVCSSVAWESHQRRAKVRLQMEVPVDVMFADGTLEEGLTADLSSSGVNLSVGGVLRDRHGEEVRVIFPTLDGEVSLPATVVDTDAGYMRAQFNALTIEEEEALTMVLYSRADTWLGWADLREPNRLFKSMGRILLLALGGARQAFEAARIAIFPSGNSKLASGAARLILLVGVFLGLTAAVAQFRSARLQASHLQSVNQAGTQVASLEPAPAARSTPDDLSELPRPFYDSNNAQPPTVSIVFLSEPSHEALRAAGIVASWIVTSRIGEQADKRPMRIAAVFGAIPHGNAIVILENASDLLPSLNLSTEAAAVSIRTNPEDPSAKLLVLSGVTGAEAVKAATGLALQSKSLAGDQVHFDHLDLPEVKQSGDPSSSDWAILPDLKRFADTGFPFTRSLDLSATTVVLPAALTQETVGLYLTVMGRLGSQTGFPALNVTVTGPEGLKSDAAKDYIVLDVAGEQPAMRQLNPSLPVTVDSEGLHLKDPQGLFAPVRHAWWKLQEGQDAGAGSLPLDTQGGVPDALLEGVQWPTGSGRTVVTISLRDNHAAAEFLTAYLAPSGSSGLAQSVSVLRGGRFASYRIGEDTYHARALPLLARMRVDPQFIPCLLALVIVFVSFLMAIPVRTLLRRRARERLLVAS